MDEQSKTVPLSSLLRAGDYRTAEQRLNDDLIASLRREIADLEAQISGESGEKA